MTPEGTIVSSSLPARDIRKEPIMNTQQEIDRYWQLGREYNYPAIADLELRAGPMAWRSFLLTRPIMIPIVIGRFKPEEE